MKAQLTTRKTLNLVVARTITEAAEAEARRNGWAVSIAVVDEAGRLLHFARMDGTPNASVEVAQGKAVHAVNYRRDTRFHQELLEKGNNAVLGLPHSLPIEGGVLLLADGEVVGAIGVSGAQSPQDGQVARAGAAVLLK
ncbi:heme-binding protein [Hymenobacter sp.]|uniref:GlcG/HbpS family heme-binding protein n=1 Tax=Hymenobacter sp. TaxID=1898978 RepID=UPI00286A3277|nr:heme-binding protein [Hymenobacter sp.]